MAVQDTSAGAETEYIPETPEPTEEPAPIYDGGDPVSDESINQNIETFGDVNQDFDNEDVSGEGAVSAGDWSRVNTGDGATQAGGDIVDSTINSGDVAGSVTGDNYDSTVGDGNVVIDESTVGAAGFGGGDATNLQGENLNLGDGTIVDDTFGDATVNSGDGDLNAIDDSYVSESALGDGDVYSDDPTVVAEGQLGRLRRGLDEARPRTRTATSRATTATSTSPTTVTSPARRLDQRQLQHGRQLQLGLRRHRCVDQRRLQHVRQRQLRRRRHRCVVDLRDHRRLGRRLHLQRQLHERRRLRGHRRRLRRRGRRARPRPPGPDISQPVTCARNWPPAGAPARDPAGRRRPVRSRRRPSLPPRVPLPGPPG